MDGVSQERDFYRRLLDSEGNTQWGVVMAGAIYVILPLLIVFLWAQRHIVEGIAAGAVKG